MEETKITNMTKEHRENVMIQGRKMMDNLSEGKSARDVMAQIYVDNLDDKKLFESLKNKVKGDSVKETVTHADPIPAQ